MKVFYLCCIVAVKSSKNHPYRNKKIKIGNANFR